MVRITQHLLRRVVLFLGLYTCGCLHASYPGEKFEELDALSRRLIGVACYEDDPAFNGENFSRDVRRLYEATKDERFLGSSQSLCDALREVRPLFADAAKLCHGYEHGVFLLKDKAEPLNAKAFHRDVISLLEVESTDASQRLKKHYAHHILNVCPKSASPLHCHNAMMRHFGDVERIEAYWMVRRDLNDQMPQVVGMVKHLERCRSGMKASGEA